MTQTDEDVFAIEIEALSGYHLNYSFVSDPGHEADFLPGIEGNCYDVNGNRTITVLGDTILPVVCWGSCSACQPGCTDPLAFNFDPGVDYDDGTCQTLGPNCQLGDMVWETLESLSILPSAGSQMVFGVPDTLDQMAIALPSFIDEPGSGTTFATMAFNPSSHEGLPPGLELLALPDSIPSNESACLVVAGIPLEMGEFELSIVGDLTISLFGQPYVIQDVAVNHAIEVLSNPNPIPGCTYSWGANFLSYATLDDGSCQLAGCTD